MALHNIKKGFSSSIEEARKALYMQLNAGVEFPQAVMRSQLKAVLLFILKLTFEGLPSINTSAGGCAGVPPSPVL